MVNFLSGAIMLGFVAGGLFFFKFYRKTGDRLFQYFAASFWLLAWERLILVILEPVSEHAVYVYLVRLLAYSLIIFAFIQKNIKTSEEIPKRDGREGQSKHIAG